MANAKVESYFYTLSNMQDYLPMGGSSLNDCCMIAPNWILFGWIGEEGWVEVRLSLDSLSGRSVRERAVDAMDAIDPVAGCGLRGHKCERGIVRVSYPAIGTNNLQQPLCSPQSAISIPDICHIASKRLQRLVRCSIGNCTRSCQHEYFQPLVPPWGKDSLPSPNCLS